MDKSKKRFANSVDKRDNIIEIEQKIKSINNGNFVGDVYLNNFKQIATPYMLENGVCLQDNNYKWLEFYNYNAKILLTAIYNQKNEIIEWYFDIARSIGKENNIPYEDDLYLDIVVTSNGEIILLDEDELKEAYERLEITKEEYDEAYKTAKDLINKVKGNEEKLKQFTDNYLNNMLEE